MSLLGPTAPVQHVLTAPVDLHVRLTTDVSTYSPRAQVHEALPTGTVTTVLSVGNTTHVAPEFADVSEEYVFAGQRLHIPEPNVLAFEYVPGGQTLHGPPLGPM
jgi:hypothetical protein